MPLYGTLLHGVGDKIQMETQKSALINLVTHV